MCGITGFFNNQRVEDFNILQSMLHCQKHRGPDAEGYFFETIGDLQVALGHRRLSIIDVSAAANQPMTFQNLVMTYNGEVYNHLEIRRELQQAGYSFSTDSDTEVVLKAFHRWGIQSLAKFRGMFAFCVVDTDARRAYLVRDRVGVKPLYYFYHPQGLVFASEIKSLHHYPTFNNRLCDAGLQLYFQYGYVPSPWTIFHDVKKIRPGHYLIYDLEKNALQEQQYWDLSSYYHQDKIQLDEQQTIEQLEAILSESFALRMVSDVPVGVFFSGGIDSTLVASILQANTARSIDTFTIGFSDHNFDESSVARKIAQHLGTNHHEQICSWQEAKAIIPFLPKMYDEPFADSSAIPTALVSQFAKQKVSVALSGDGGDEMFCGYSSYWINQKRFEFINNLRFKRQIGKLLSYIPDPMMSFYKINFDLYNRYLKFKSLLDQPHLEEKYRLITQIFTRYDLAELRHNAAISAMPNDVFNALNPLERMMLSDFNRYLPDDLLVKVDRASMFYSLEGREPLLDHKILEFAARLPMALKFKKNILKKILGKYLPNHYIDRKKHGFGVPINAWLRGELKELLCRYLNVDKIKQQGIFNPHYVEKLCRAFLNSKTNDNRVWTLLMFQMWHEEYCSENF